MSTVNDLPNPTPDDSVWQQQRRYRTCGRLLVPLLLITLGVMFLLAEYHIVPAHSAWEFFWPFIFIFFGVNMLGRGRTAMGAIFVVIGAALVGEPMGWWHYDVSHLWPVILILLGVAMLTGGWEPRRRLRYQRWRYRGGQHGVWQGFGSSAPDGGADAALPDDPAKLDAVAFLGGFQRRVTAQDFSGGRITAFMGGFQLDLRRAQIAGDAAVLDISAVLGGGEIMVPTAWVIDMHGQGLLGGYSDETHQDPPLPGAKHLVIQGTSLFGGIVVKN